MFRRSKKSQQPPVKSPNKAPVFQYYRVQSSGRQAEERPGRRRQPDTRLKNYLKFHRGNLPTLFAGLLVAAAFLGNLYVSSSPILKLGEGSSVFGDHSSYELRVSQVLSDSLLNRNKLTFNSRELESWLLEEFPELSSAAVSLPLIGNQAVVGLEFSVPSLNVQTSSGSFVVGNDGRILSKGLVVQGLPTVQDASGLDYKVGQRAFTQEDVQFFSLVAENYKTRGFTIESIKAGASARDIEVQTAGEAYFVKFNLLNDAAGQLGALWAIKEELGNRSESPAEYIDVRLADRVFVK